MCHGMVETKQESMQAQAVHRVISVAVFRVATNRMSHVSGMHADLVLAPGLQFEFHQRVLCRPGKGMEMGQLSYEIPYFLVQLDCYDLLMEADGEATFTLSTQGIGEYVP